MPGEFEYDPARNISVYDAVNLAGGLRPDALPKAYVVRTDTATGARTYALFNLEKAMTDLTSNDNFSLEPLDRIVILSNSIINTESTVSIGGAVKNPGKFKYGNSMTLLDAVTLSGGLKAEAATNRVEIYRVILNNNEPTQVTASTFEIPRDLIMAQEIMSHVLLEPFDMIEVRSVPKFGLQKVVSITGEVRFPGEYALVKDNETIYELIKRAGGLTPEAFTGGATLDRNMDKTGLVIIELDEIMKRPGASYNITLLHGDALHIPKNNDLVSIQGAVNIQDIASQELINENHKINVAFIEGKSARYYIREFAGGFAENADRAKVYVKDANGKKSKVHTFLFFKKYPKVKKAQV
ncbi:MAG: SLBB domain-containing protein [Saprospiraceae bacterium]|nr:SLBB domain-containing protein [Candidatus Parvibacillus calidus]